VTLKYPFFLKVVGILDAGINIVKLIEKKVGVKPVTIT
jgi:hypothetical protein